MLTHNVRPQHLSSEYKSTILRSPTKPLVPVKELLRDISLPAFGESVIGKWDNDLTKNARINGEPIGERIKVFGNVMDEYGRPLRNVLVEIWQANAAGRYIHKEEIHDAPLDPNFLGGGRILSDQVGDICFILSNQELILGAIITMLGGPITFTSRLSASGMRHHDNQLFRTSRQIHGATYAQ